MTNNTANTKKKNKNKYGQYFTPEAIAEFMIELADVYPQSNILEPSCGEGIFLKLLNKKNLNKIVAYELDPELAANYPYVKHESFVSADIQETFDLIIGNPPYIRWGNLEQELKEELLSNPLWTKYFNSLCDYLYIFIVKSIELLKENGQLIFICPEYWFNTTHSLSLRNYMVNNGYFEEIYHFNETPIFEKVTVSIVIFKYVKSKNKNKNKNIFVSKYHSNKKISKATLQNLKNQNHNPEIEQLSIPQFKINERWVLLPEEEKEKLKIFELHCINKSVTGNVNLFSDASIPLHTIGDFCDIGNGLVSGLDKAFQFNQKEINENEKTLLLKVIKAKDLTPYKYNNTTDYIFLTNIENESELKHNCPNFYNQFQFYKNELNNRYQYNRLIHYWEWVFLRNLSLFKKQEPRIFVPCKERISNKNHFRFSLVEENIFPTQDVTAIFKKKNTKESIEYIVSYLNQPFVFNWLKHNGIVKGSIVEFSEKPIASIPFRAIDWKIEQEVFIHNKISELCKKYIINKDEKIIQEISLLFDKLFS